MKIVIQRVQSASVQIEGSLVSSIDQGLVLLVGIGADDTVDMIDPLIKKILNLRIFADEDAPMNKNICDIGGSILSVSQFTLYADCRKGNRPSFSQAMRPEQAQSFYEIFFNRLKQVHTKTYDGIFGAEMKVELVNDGPVTIIVETSNVRSN